MKRRLIAEDPITGIATFHEYNPDTDETTLIYVGDDGPCLEENKRLANDDEYTKNGIKQEFWRYASIPPSVQLKWLTEKGVDVYNKEHGKAVGRLVNDREWGYLKTTTKHHEFK